jgi:anti-sigma-K factor RskA
VAQTKRKTKHRGNAAGMVESRGRTGRRPTAAERSGAAREKAKAKEQRLSRYDRPPTWRGAFYRAAAAAVVLLLVGIVLLKNSSEAIALFPIVLALYVPISYYTDVWMYKRRLRQKARAGSAAK